MSAYVYNIMYIYICVYIEPFSALTSALVHVCMYVLWPGCSPYGSRDMENLSLSSFLYLCQALLFLLHPFPSLTSVRELTMLSCSGVLSPPSLPPSLLPSCLPFLISHSLSYFYEKKMILSVIGILL